MEVKKQNTEVTFNYTVKEICFAFDKLFDKKKLERLEKSKQNGN